MPIQHTLWTVDTHPSKVITSELADEKQLEDMIVSEPAILSDDWMLIGRQIHTGTGLVDLLAIADDASLVLIELKRDKTPREVIAQTLDYALWLENLKPEQVVEIYKGKNDNASLSDDFRTRFDRVLDDENEPINHSHQLVVVASTLDPSSERIVRYLNEQDVPINVLTFKVFQHGDTKFLSRAWLLDSFEIKDADGADPSQQSTWNNEFYACFGHDENRDWEEAVKYGFISGGGGKWYSNSLKMLEKDARVWVKVPGRGFVGVGRIIGPRQSATEFEIDGRPALQVLKAKYLQEVSDDPDLMEYFVPVKWLDTVSMDKAVQEPGMFGNQNTVCRPKSRKWHTTVEKLKDVFKKFDDEFEM